MAIDSAHKLIADRLGCRQFKQPIERAFVVAAARTREQVHRFHRATNALPHPSELDVGETHATCSALANDPWVINDKAPCEIERMDVHGHTNSRCTLHV